MTRAIPSPLSPYLDIDALSAEAASLGTPEVYGRSVQGRDLLAVSLPGDGPVVLVTAGIHGNEFIGVRTALEVLRGGPIPGARLLVCPVLNPDGYAATSAAGGGGQRQNAHRVDLNRNFPLPWGARPSRVAKWLGGGSDLPGEATFRGASPLSEPETASLAALVTARAPQASANLHSFLGTLFCARVWHPNDWFAYQHLARAFRAGQGAWPGYRRVGTPVFDVFTGELEDWQHHVVRCWAVCVECFSLRESFAQQPKAVDPFWRFNPRDPDPVARRDAAGVRAMLTASLALDRPPLRDGAAVVRAEW